MRSGNITSLWKRIMSEPVGDNSEIMFIKIKNLFAAIYLKYKLIVLDGELMETGLEFMGGNISYKEWETFRLYVISRKMELMKNN